MLTGASVVCMDLMYSCYFVSLGFSYFFLNYSTTLFFHSDVYLSAPLTEIVGCGVQVSQVYQTMKISNLTNMIGFFDFSVVEKIAVDAVKYNFFQVKIDHLKGIVGFGSQVSIFAAPCGMLIFMLG
jgi:hypothetical protein